MKQKIDDFVQCKAQFSLLILSQLNKRSVIKPFAVILNDNF